MSRIYGYGDTLKAKTTHICPNILYFGYFPLIKKDMSGLLAADKELEGVAAPHGVGDLNDRCPGKNSINGIAAFA